MKGKPGKTIMTGFGDAPGRPVIDRSLCNSCGMCVRVCKSFTLLMNDGEPAVMPDNGLGCIACGQCMAVCPRGAIRVNGRKLSFEKTFPLPPRKDRATPEALNNLLVARRSVREFSKREVDRGAIDRLLEMAATAPMGIPPSDVGVTVVHGTERVQVCAGDIMKVFGKWRAFFNPLVMALMRPFMKKAEAEMFDGFILPAIGFMFDARKEGTDLLFYHAPCVLLFHQSPYADPVDGQIACTYAMLAAESLGLGTCMIGTVAYAFNREKALKKKWGIPAENTVSIAMIMGHPGFKYARGVKREFASVRYV